MNDDNLVVLEYEPLPVYVTVDLDRGAIVDVTVDDVPGDVLDKPLTDVDGVTINDPNGTLREKAIDIAENAMWPAWNMGF